MGLLCCVFACFVVPLSCWFVLCYFVVGVDVCRVCVCSFVFVFVCARVRASLFVCLFVCLIGWLVG